MRVIEGRFSKTWLVQKRDFEKIEENCPEWAGVDISSWKLGHRPNILALILIGNNSLKLNEWGEMAGWILIIIDLIRFWENNFDLIRFGKKKNCDWVLTSFEKTNDCKILLYSQVKVFLWLGSLFITRSAYTILRAKKKKKL